MKGPSDERRRELAIQASRRMVSQGERPLFRLRIRESELGLWVEDDSGLGAGGWVEERRDAADVGRWAIAQVLDVDPDRFQVEVTAQAPAGTD